MSKVTKDVIWCASSKKDLSKFPDDVRDVMGYGIFQAQLGKKHVDAKPLSGFGGAGVLEIIDCSDGDLKHPLIFAPGKCAFSILAP
jgi:phage-related protein